MRVCTRLLNPMFAEGCHFVLPSCARYPAMAHHKEGEEERHHLPYCKAARSLSAILGALGPDESALTHCLRLGRGVTNGRVRHTFAQYSVALRVLLWMRQIRMSSVSRTR